MKKISLPALVLFMLTNSQPIFAQSKQEKPGNAENQEIIIQKKGIKDGKIVLEIKDGVMYINGKRQDKLDINTDSVKVSVRVAPRVNFYTLPDTRLGAPREEIVENGGSKAFLGVSTEAAPESGARIVSVSENSAAQKAGLQNGDIITAVDQTSINNPADLVETITKYKPSTEITISYQREGKAQTTKATLGEAKNTTIIRRNFRTLPDQGNGLNELNFEKLLEGNLDSAFSNFKVPGMEHFNFEINPRPKLGIKVQDLEEGRGAKVLDIVKDSPAEKAGLKTGDVITEFDGKKIEEAEDMIASIKSSSEKSNFNVVVKRDGKTQTLTIKIPKKLKTADL